SGVVHGSAVRETPALQANPGVGRPSGLRVATHTPPGFSTAPDGHLRDQVAAHIEGGAARLTEAWVSIMRCETKADRGGLHCGASAGCARYAPGQDTCEHVSAGQCDSGERPPEP